jgi:hypothetical protein
VVGIDDVMPFEVVVIGSVDEGIAGVDVVAAVELAEVVVFVVGKVGSAVVLVAAGSVLATAAVGAGGVTVPKITLRRLSVAVGVLLIGLLAATFPAAPLPAVVLGEALFVADFFADRSAGTLPMAALAAASELNGVTNESTLSNKTNE